ncbi:MAG: GGDEF domain-containing protein, partial [Acetobacteraceae bacterium]
MPLAETEAPGGEPRREQVVAHAYAAIASMAKHAVPPSPPCFTVWYNYHAGDNTMVRRVLDTYLSNGRPITDALLQEIHARFFDTHREATALTHTTDRLREATEQVAGLIKDSGGQTARYGTALGQFSDDIGRNGADLQGALGRIIADTQDMAERTARLGERLEGSARIITELRDQLEEALRESRTDVLTGLPNRRAVETMAQHLARTAQEKGRPLALGMLDIDRFKSINDTWGHPVGDAVLRRVAGTLRDSVLPDAFCGRFGGEEFVVLLPGYDLQAACQLAERLRQAVEAQSFSLRDGGKPLGVVTLSAGVAVQAWGEAWSGLLSRADAALYRAKQAGRNRVVWD